MDLYNSSPGKKVGQKTEINEDNWASDERGVIQKINSSASKLDQQRKVSLDIVKSWAIKNFFTTVTVLPKMPSPYILYKNTSNSLKIY